MCDNINIVEIYIIILLNKNRIAFEMILIDKFLFLLSSITITSYGLI